MKNASFKYQLCVILAVLSYLSSHAQVRKPPCPFDQYLVDHPDVRERVYAKARERAERLRNKPAQFRNDEIYQIPVVFHIVWFDESENISDQQIMAQLAVLNEDYNKLNLNQDIVPSLFDTLIANVGFEFCLAKKDPDGNDTSGINRIRKVNATPLASSNINDTHPVQYTNMGGQDAWDPDHYLNIWVTKISDGVLGFVKPDHINTLEDGVVIAPSAIGCSVEGQNINHLGRTLTHEIGHYFGLFHLENGEGCDAVNDFMVDTPVQIGSYGGCPEFPSRTCGSIDMTMNFMQWCDDACLAMFTPDQKDYMRDYLVTYRPGLIETNNCQPPVSNADLSDDFTIYPNPTNSCIHVISEIIAPEGEIITVSLHDMNGRQVYHAINRVENIRPIDALPLANGIYVLKLRINKKVISKKVFVLK